MWNHSFHPSPVIKDSAKEKKALAELKKLSSQFDSDVATFEKELRQARRPAGATRSRNG